MEVQEVSVDEMWKVIESFGISRKMMEMQKLSNEKIKELYLMIRNSKTRV